MLIVAAILTFAFLAVIALFAFPRFSPIPYFPTNWQDLEKIVGAFHLTKNSEVIDLGAGTGTVIFALAHHAHRYDLPVRLVAVEINPVLVLILHLKRLIHPCRKQIVIVWTDLFTTSYSTLTASGRKTTVYLYVSPRLLTRISKKIQEDLPQARVVSYMYSLPDRSPRRTIRTGNHPIFLYN